MTRSDAEKRVIEAARAFVPILKRAEAETRNLLPKGDGYAEAMALVSTVDALSALPPATEPEPEPEPAGEVVEVRAAVRRHSDGLLTVYGSQADGSTYVGTKRGDWIMHEGEDVIATIRARVTLPPIPEVVGEVEG